MEVEFVLEDLRKELKDKTWWSRHVDVKAYVEEIPDNPRPRCILHVDAEPKDIFKPIIGQKKIAEMTVKKIGEGKYAINFSDLRYIFDQVGCVESLNQACERVAEKLRVFAGIEEENV